MRGCDGWEGDWQIIEGRRVIAPFTPRRPVGADDHSEQCTSLEQLD